MRRFCIAMHKNRVNLCLFAKWAIWEYFPQEKIEQLKGKFKGNIKICVPKTFFFEKVKKEEKTKKACHKYTTCRHCCTGRLRGDDDYKICLVIAVRLTKSFHSYIIGIWISCSHLLLLLLCSIKRTL